MKVEYDFLRVGSVVTPRPGYLFLDVGNRLGDGVIDTHPTAHAAETATCSSSLIVEDPTRVTDWVMPDESLVHIVLHEDPDFDCVASSLLALRLLEAHAAGKPRPDNWESWAPPLATSASRIDQGKTRLGLPAPGAPTVITPYLSLLVLHDLASEKGLPKRKALRWVIEQGHRVLERAIELALLAGAKDIDCVDLRGKLDDLQELERRIDQRVAAFARDGERIGLGRGSLAGSSKLDNIYPLMLPDRADPGRQHSAKMASIVDPECGGAFFKSLMRGAFRSEVDATCVFSTEPKDPVTGSAAWVRSIISVDPETPFDLRGLGRALEMEEKDARVHKSMPRVGAPRPGYDNPDPWYDGRAYGYTIVDAPRWGTVLTPDRVIRVVLDWQRWQHLRLQDLAAVALEALHALHIPEAKRAGTLRTLLAFATGENARDAAYQLQWMARAALQFAQAAGPADSELLLEVVPRVTPALIAACASCEQPSNRVWALNCAAASPDASLEFAETIGRSDLSLAIHVAAAKDGASVAAAIHGVKADRLLRPHTLLIDAAASLISRGHHLFVSPLRDLLAASATKAALRPAVVNLARYPCDDPFFHNCAQAALAGAVAQLRMVKRGGDAVAHEWANLRRTVGESGTISALADDRGAAEEELAAARECVLRSLHPPAIEWLDALTNADLTPEDLSVAGNAVAEKKLGFLDALALLSILAEAPARASEHAREHEWPPERAALVSGEVVRVLQALLNAILPLAANRHELSMVEVERCAISDAVRQIISLTGTEAFLDSAAQLRPALLRALNRGAPFLLQDGAVFSSEEATRAGIDVVFSSNAVEVITAAQEVVATRAAATLVTEVLELARAVETERRIPDSAPSYAAAGLAFRLLPIVAQHQTAPAEQEKTLQKAYELTVGLATEKELTTNYRSSAVPLADIIETDLRHIVAYRTILAAFECSLARLNVLLRAADLLRPLPARSAGCAVKVIEWVAELPQREGCKALQDILSLRDDLAESDPDARSVQWCGRILEVVHDCFRSAATNTLDAPRLRIALRDIRLLRPQRPDGGMALLLSLALDDVISYVQCLRDAFGKLEESELRHDDRAADELATAVLEISTIGWLQAEFRSDASRPAGRNTVLRPDSLKDDGGVVAFFGSVQARFEALYAEERRLEALHANERHTEASPSAERAAYVSEVRHVLGRDKRPLVDPKPLESESRATTGEVTDTVYQRHKALMHLDAATVDRIFDRLVERSLKSYDLKRARRLIDEYSLMPPSFGFAAWFSGAILAVPLAFLALFVSYNLVATNYQKNTIAMSIEIGLVLTLVVVWLPFIIAGRERRRLKTHAERVAGLTMKASIERLEERKRQLFLPRFLVPVLVGVYSVVLTDEVGLKVAAKIQDGPLLLLLLGFAWASALVLEQLIVRGGGTVTVSNLFGAGAKIFTYAFLIAVSLSIIVAPLIRYELREAEREDKELLAGKTDGQELKKVADELKAAEREIHGDHLLPVLQHAQQILEKAYKAEVAPSHLVRDQEQKLRKFFPSEVKITAGIFASVAPAIYPRHIMLYGMLGMFIGIFLHGFLHVKDEKVDPT